MDIFDIKLGTAAKPYLTDDTLGVVAVQMLDAVQTIVNVLTDAEGGGWRVSFDPGMSAYTERTDGKRNICISVKPLLDAPVGTKLADIAAVMAGFAIHEIGHTKLDFFTAVKNRWPGKQLPITLANIIEDEVLEARTVDRYNGFADHGSGTVFHPTLEWVARKTSPTFPLEWKGSTGQRVNIVGQMLRYRDYVTFSNDKATQDALAWVDQWSTGITADLTPSGCVALIEALIAYMKATEDEEPPVQEPPQGPTTDGGEDGIPNEDGDDDTEGGENPTEGGDEGNPGGDAGDGDTEGDDGDGKGTEGDGDDTGNGGMDSDTEGDEDSDDTDGGDDTTDGGEGNTPTDGNTADHGDRTESEKGTNDGDGAGGSGQSVSEASDDVDDGFDEADLDPTFDDLSRPKDRDPQQDRVNLAEREERSTVRMDAGAHGKMRVVFK